MRTLVDTSVWIQHLKEANLELISLLEIDDVLAHSAVIGELAAGTFKNRQRVLGDLKLVPTATEATPEEVLELIISRRLHGKGLSWVDLHLLASALVTKCDLFTFDKGLSSAYLELR